MKICSVCKESKPFDFFPKKRNQCKECVKKIKRKYKQNPELKKKFYEKNKIEILKSKKEYRKDNLEKLKNYNKEYVDLNKEKLKKYQKNYRQSNKIVLSKKQNEYQKNRKKNDPLFKLICNLRGLYYHSFNSKGMKKNTKTENLLGCSFSYIKEYIESKFKPWMSWDNYGKFNGELNYGWDLDHIIPISHGKTHEEIIKLSHYTNLQPLCSYTNRIIKKDILTT
jgi:hypothetical protein